MLSNAIFYHAITRKVIVAFGTLFSNIKIARKNINTGLVEQTLAVPITYAPKEKWIVRIDQDPMLENHTYTTLPRMSFEITNISYDPQRRTNRMNKISCAGQDGLTSTYAPVPYNIEISLYALTKTQEDGLQILEQIIPYFGPEFTMSLNAIPEKNIVLDIPIILNSTSINDEYDGDFQTRRFITYTMNFTLKANFFGPISDTGIIKHVFVDVASDKLFQNIFADYEVHGDDQGNITGEQWTDR